MRDVVRARVRLNTWPDWDQPTWLVSALRSAGVRLVGRIGPRPDVVFRRVGAPPELITGVIDVGVVDGAPERTGSPLWPTGTGAVFACLATSNHLALTAPDGCPTTIVRAMSHSKMAAPPSGRVDDDHVLRISWAAPMHWVSGYEDVLMALAQLRMLGQPFRAELSGRGPDRERIVYTVRDLDISEEVCLSDRDHRVPGPADVFIDTSLRCGSGADILDAMADGLPVVASDLPTTTELVEAPLTGALVPRRDPEALAEMLLSVAGDRAGWSARGAAGRRRWEEMGGCDVLAPLRNLR
jgi:glycosyltransferase involved in cell wall biosynthesis